MVARCYMASVLFTLSYLIAIVLRVSRVDGLCLLPVLLKSRRILSLSDVFTFHRIAVVVGQPTAETQIVNVTCWTDLLGPEVKLNPSIYSQFLQPTPFEF